MCVNEACRILGGEGWVVDSHRDHDLIMYVFGQNFTSGVRKNTHIRKTTYLIHVLNPDGSLFDLKGYDSLSLSLSVSSPSILRCAPIRWHRAMRIRRIQTCQVGRKNTHIRKTTYLVHVLNPGGSLFDLKGYDSLYLSLSPSLSPLPLLYSPLRCAPLA